MAITSEILSHERPDVAKLWLYWADRMHQEIEFWPIDDGLDVHTESHCERVLLHAIRIGMERNVSSQALEALCHASIFHDTRRKDNFLDVGHGDRAADYYRAFCEDKKLNFLSEAFGAIKFHDRDDQLGEDYLDHQAEAVEVYRIFKDADALDRYRLGPWMLDTRYLRTPEAIALTGYAQELVEKTIPHADYEAMKAWTRPFAERMGWKGE